MAKVYKGRQKIYTSLELTDDNIPKILNAALQIHRTNASEIKYLRNYALGQQPILDRVKVIREEICNNTVFNLAFSSVRTIVGYTYGQPIQYSLRTTDKQKEIKELNDYMDYESSHAVDIEIAWDCAEVGVGYKGCFPDKEATTDDVPFEIMSLNPETTFVVQSTKLGNKDVLSCSYEITLDEKGNEKDCILTVYTDKMEYMYKTPINGVIGTESIVSGYPKAHVLGGNPIKAYWNNQFLLGDFEIALSVLDAINTIGSNSIDDIEQVVQAVLVILGVSAEQKQELSEIKTGSVLMLPGSQGIQQDAKFITSQLDSGTIKELREYLNEMANIIIGIPERKTRGGGGGDTGDAVKLRDGWADIEILARNKEMFWKRTEKEMLKVLLNILHIKGKVKNLKPIDIDIKFTRNKMDNLITKTQAGSTMYNMGMDKQDIVNAMDITTDTVEVVKRWEANEKEKQKVITDIQTSV